jgi:hypothetical protein
MVPVFSLIIWLLVVVVEKMVGWFMVYNFQQYFCYIVAVNFIGGSEGTGEPGQNHRPVASH